MSNHRGEEHEYYRRHRVTGGPAPLPPPVRSFGAAPFPRLRPALLATGWEAPTPVQAASWAALAAERDLVAIAQTGAGKTLAYLVPALHACLLAEAGAPTALVLAPTRELAVQIYQQAEQFGGRDARCVCCCGGRDLEPQMAALATGSRMVVGTPGRLLYLCGRGAADLTKVRFWVLDEADRMLDMGFAPQVTSLAADLPRDRRTALLSATWCSELDELSEQLLSKPLRLFINQSDQTAATPCRQIEQAVEVLPAESKLTRLLQALAQLPEASKALVFANTKRGCDELASQLRWKGFAGADAIHANRTQYEREVALTAFKSGESPVLVATDVAARGIDVSGIALVVNWDFPCTLGAAGVEDYVHRIGRTARAGATGKALTFFPTKPDDKHPANSHHLVKLLRACSMPVSDALARLDRGDTVSARNQRKHGKQMQMVAVSGSAAQRARRFDLVKELQAAGDARDRATAEQVWARFGAEQLPHSVYSFAAGVKAAVSCGDVARAAAMVAQMSSEGLQPNIVVHTTLLKGYAAVGDMAGAERQMSEMLSSESAIDLRAANTFLRGCVRVGAAAAALRVFNKMESEWGLQPDATSYKYVSRLLAQTLQYQKLKKMLSKLRAAERKADKQAARVLSELGNWTAMHLDLAGAAAVLGKFKTARANLDRALQVAATKRPDTLFDLTRREELERAARVWEPFVAAAELAPGIERLFARVLLFGSQLGLEQAGESGPEVAAGLVRQLQETFGLGQMGAALEAEAARRIHSCISEQGQLRWKRVFSAKRKRGNGTELPVKMEICCGSGDWVVAQAAAEAGVANWVAVELRHDRVHSVWQKMLARGLDNLSVVCVDASRLLKQHVKPSSLACCCINYPEPPHWTGNAQAESMLHLLSPQFFRRVHAVLEAGGRLTILSDNQQYCQSLAAEMGKLRGRGAHPLFTNTRLDETSQHGAFQEIEVHCGLPGAESGHIVQESSQFDRFWANGQYTNRYFIAVNKA